MKNKLIAGLLAISLTACQCAMTANAYELSDSVSTKSDLIKLSDEQIDQCVKDVALDWAKSIEPNKELKVSNVSKINQLNSDVPEYTVSYYSGKTPYGYAVVTFQNNDVSVKESVIDKGEKSIYDDLVDKVEETAKIPQSSLDIGKQIIEISPMQYGVTANIKGEKVNPKKLNVYGSSGFSGIAEDLFDVARVAIHTKYLRHQDIFITKSDFLNKKKFTIDQSKKITLRKYIAKRELLNDSYVEERTGLYCCAIQAIFQIAYMEGLTSYSDKDIKTNYKYLWENGNVHIAKKKGNVICGEASLRNSCNSLKSLAKQKKYNKFSSYTYKGKPSVNWFKQRLKDNNPILFCYGLNVDGAEECHAISVVAYMPAKDLSKSGKNCDFLKVYDSWRGAPHYMNYSTDFTLCEAAYFSIKK